MKPVAGKCVGGPYDGQFITKPAEDFMVVLLLAGDDFPTMEVPYRWAHGLWIWQGGKGPWSNKATKNDKVPEEKHMADKKLAEAARAALEHVLELEDAWLRGAIDERDGRGGTRSNRNTDVRNLLRDALEHGTDETRR